MATLNERIKLMENFPKFDFKNRHIWLVGQGAIGPNLLYIILKLFIIKQKQITVIDLKPLEQLQKEVKEIAKIVRPDESFEIEVLSAHIKQDNYKEYFEKVSEGDVIVDCAIEISSSDVIKLCQNRKAIFVTSAIEVWNYADTTDPYSYTIFSKLTELRKYANKLNDKCNFTAMLGFGCNPGMVSIWAQVGVRMINDYYKNTTPKTPEELGIRTVHISEVDTQRSKKPKDKDEYCNTWASTAEPFYEEALAPLELTLGTHEDLPTKNVVYYDKKNTVLIMDCIAKNVLAQSYTPLYGNFTGMLIRHEENVTIGEKLSTYADIRGKKIKTYSPSVYYVYKPSGETLLSLHELRDKNHDYQKNTRLLADDIIDGRDELGLSFFLENGDVFWIGSLLDIEETRMMFDKRFHYRTNATILQVIAGFLLGIMDGIERHNKKDYGVFVPDDCDAEAVFTLMKPFYGEFVFKKVEDWDYSNINRIPKFSRLDKAIDKKESEWKLTDFLLDPKHIIGLNKMFYYHLSNLPMVD